MCTAEGSGTRGAGTRTRGEREWRGSGGGGRCVAQLALPSLLGGWLALVSPRCSFSVIELSLSSPRHLAAGGNLVSLFAAYLASQDDDDDSRDHQQRRGPALLGQLLADRGTGQALV